MKNFCIIYFHASSNSCIHRSTWELHVFFAVFILLMVSSSSVQICDTTRISGIHLILPLTIHTAHFTSNNSYTFVLPLIIHTPENGNYFFTSNNSYTQNLNYFWSVWIIRIKTVKRIFGGFGVPTYFKSSNTLRQLLVHPKDPVGKDKVVGPVYKISCEECDATYVGETNARWRQGLESIGDQVPPRQMSRNIHTRTTPTTTSHWRTLRSYLLNIKGSEGGYLHQSYESFTEQRRWTLQLAPGLE